MTEITPDMLKQFPIFRHMATFAATLELAQVEPIEDMGGADLESISGDTKVLVITFADKTERAAFLEAVKFVQGKKDEAK